jgi:AraC-like DNA-binding protein
MTDAWSSGTASSFARSLEIPKRKQSGRFSRLSAMMQWVLRQSKSGLTASKMAAHWRTVTNVLGGHQQAGMQMSLRMCALEDRRLTVREIADEVGISTGSAHSILTDDLHMCRVVAKFVPKLLSQ